MPKKLDNHRFKKGIIIMVVAAIMFSVLYLFSSWMKPLTGTAVFAWRMLGMCFGLLSMIIVSNKLGDMKSFLLSLQSSPKKLLMMLATTPILASQLWLFMWAGVNGHAVDVSIGYLLFPLTMVASGWLFIKEAVSPLQWFAISLATVGVTYQIWMTQIFSWATLWVCAVYPIYYLLRRQFAVPALIGLSFDLILIAPFCLLYLVLTGDFAIITNSSKFWFLIPLLGTLSALAMQMNLEASRLLTVPIFGMLSYLEPIIMFVFSITILAEIMSKIMMVSFTFISIGLFVSMIDGWQKHQKAMKFNSDYLN